MKRKIISPAEFFARISSLAARPVLRMYRRLSPSERQQVDSYWRRILQDHRLKKNEELRMGASRLIVALLPKTFPLLEKTLSDQESPFWYEVHFTIFCKFDRDDLTDDQQQRVLKLVHDYLANVRSEAGFAAWKAGDLLGDEWKDAQTVDILEDLLASARFVAGRKAAAHGLEHALNTAACEDGERIIAAVRKAARNDPSEAVRSYAAMGLRGVGCGPSVRAYRRKWKRKSP